MRSVPSRPTHRRTFSTHSDPEADHGRDTQRVPAPLVRVLAHEHHDRRGDAQHRGEGEHDGERLEHVRCRMTERESAPKGGRSVRRIAHRCISPSVMRRAGREVRDVARAGSPTHSRLRRPTRRALRRDGRRQPDLRRDSSLLVRAARRSRPRSRASAARCSGPRHKLATVSSVGAEPDLHREAAFSTLAWRSRDHRRGDAGRCRSARFRSSEGASLESAAQR